MIELLVLGLATWRLTSLLNAESGPYNILTRLRYLIGVRYNDHSEPYGKNQVAEMILCTWCLSVWVGLILGITYYFWRDFWWVMVPFSLSAVAIVIERLVGE